MKAKDKDFYRWLVYSIVLLILAFAVFKWHAAFIYFVIALIIALGDVFYTQYTKYLGH